MAKLLGEFLHELAKKAGMKDDDEALKNFITADAFQKIEVPEEIQRGIDNNLINLTDAKNNHPQIKSHYQALALTPLDQYIDQALEEYGIPEEMREEIKGERSTYKKVPLFAKRIKELEAKKANTSDKGDKVQFQKQIDELHEKARKAEEEKQALKIDYENKLLNSRIGYKLRELTNSYKTVLDTLEPDAKMTAIETLINKALQDKNAKFTFDENGNFALRQKDDTNFYGDNNQQVNPQQFIDSIMSHNKLLVTAAPPVPGANGNQSNNGQTNQPKGGSGTNTQSAALKDMIAQAQKDFTSAHTFQ